MNRLWKIIFIILTLLLVSDTAMANNRLHLFFISKSENKNQVHYAINLDNKCAPVGDAPVYAYWQMLEKGPGFTEGLLEREQRPYGIGSQSINKNVVSFALNSVPHKTITVTSSTENGVCHIKTTTLLNGEVCILDSIYIDLWIFGVRKITAYGRRIKDGVHVEEEIK